MNWELLVLLAIVAGALGRKGAPTTTATDVSSSKPAQPPSAPQVKAGDTLVPGAKYAAQIKLTGLEAMLGTASAVKSKLEAAGFKDVKVTDQGGGSFAASGTWGGAAVAAKLPSQVVSVWRAS